MYRLWNVTRREFRQLPWYARIITMGSGLEEEITSADSQQELINNLCERVLTQYFVILFIFLLLVSGGVISYV